MTELLPWSNDDLWAVERFLCDPEMMKHLGGAQTREQAVDQHERYLATADSGAGQMFKIVLGPATEAIGNIGYWDKTWRGEIVYETGWMILPEYQGRGYASDAVILLVERLRREHMHQFLHAFPAGTNGPSNALCRKAGFTNLGECEFEYPVGHPMRCNDWRLDLSLYSSPPPLSVIANTLT
jgi:RimJ/RimL family protein N-acetyltransferase